MLNAVASDVAEVNFTELRNIALDCIDSGTSLDVRSPPGRGKSEFFQDLIEYCTTRDGFEWGYAPAFLATYTPPDLVGYQFKGERPWGPNGEMVAVTEPTMPMWMQTYDKKPVYAFKRGLVVLEEYGQGESDVKRASAQLLLKGEIGPWALPGFNTGDGWGVVALSNRFGRDRSGVTKDFDFVINRRMEVHVKDDPVPWAVWAVRKKIPPIIVSFAMQYPQLVWTKDVPEKQGPWCTPRSLVQSARFLMQRMARTGGEIDSHNDTQSAVSGLIGRGTMSHLFTHIKLERDIPSIAKVEADPLGTPMPDAADMRMLIVYSFSYKVQKDNMGPVLQYVERMGKDMTMAFVRAACIRDGTLMNSAPIAAWSKRNSSLIVQISQSIH
jgi:hypothetical protein